MSHPLPVQPAISSISNGIPSSLTWSPVNSGLIKHIPRSARPACASHLAGLLRAAASHPEVPDNWLSIFDWSGSILVPPKRGGKRHNLASTIKKRICSFSLYSQSVEPVVAPSYKRLSDDAVLAQAIAAKLEDGNIRAAIRILCSDDTLATPSAETLSKLQQKHPQSSFTQGSLSAPLVDSAVQVVESDVRKAVLSFPAGSSGGPDGFRPQHLKDLMQCRESGADFLCALTAFINTVLSGRCPSDMAAIFFGGRLLALNKKDGGIRPIAVGFSLRRLASKCANAFGLARLSTNFCPRQLGVGVAGGCEAAIHSARRYLESLPAGHVLVKLDFSNAFNCLHRFDMLQAIRNKVPELYSYCYSAYCQPSNLFFGSHILLSQEGPQQGDPLGPLLFCNAIQELVDSLCADLNLSYLDDLTLGGPEEAIAQDVQRIIEVGDAMGLHLNIAKCELITSPDFHVSDATLRSFSRISIADASLLGAPLFPGEVLDETWAAACSELSRAVERLKCIGSQDALILLRSSFSAPRVQHLLRCSPSVDHPALLEFDELLRSAVSLISNSVLSDDQWLQASLPIKDGGLGIRRVSSLATPAFLASAASTLPLQSRILAACTYTSDSVLQTNLSSWSLAFGPLPDPLPIKQSFYDRTGVDSVRSQAERSLSSTWHRASFLAATAPHSGDWLLALPITSCGLRLDDEAVRAAVGIRLGLNLCEPHTCPCGAMVDARGLHSFVCKAAPGRTARHHALNDVIYRAFSSAGIPATKEPVASLALTEKGRTVSL